MFDRLAQAVGNLVARANEGFGRLPMLGKVTILFVAFAVVMALATAIPRMIFGPPMDMGDAETPEVATDDGETSAAASSAADDGERAESASSDADAASSTVYYGPADGTLTSHEAGDVSASQSSFVLNGMTVNVVYDVACEVDDNRLVAALRSWLSPRLGDAQEATFHVILQREDERGVEGLVTSYAVTTDYGGGARFVVAMREDSSVRPGVTTLDDDGWETYLAGGEVTINSDGNGRD